MIELKTERDLLEKVNIINKKYDEIAEITGEKFNIFNILRVERKEVSTHSAIIGELLNPKGSHGKKDLFLRLFIQVTQLEFAEEEMPDRTCKVFVEKHTGTIDEERLGGGRIDIIIEWGKKAIIIENKIDAGDQKNQLLRYYNYAIEKRLDFELIYLTKDGQAPQMYTTGGVQEIMEKTKSISYKKNVIEWLELCKKEASSLPILRETLSQYIYLIKKLTNQTINHKMSNELENLITNSADNFSAAQSIVNEIESANLTILKTFWEEVGHRACTHLEGNWSFQYLNGWGIFIYPSISDAVGFCADFKKSQLGIYKFDYPNKDKSKYFHEIINTEAQSNLYKFDIPNYHLFNISESDNLNILREELLREILPLKNSNFYSTVNMLTEKIASYCLEDKTFGFVVNTANKISHLTARLQSIQAILAPRLIDTNLSRLEIWENHVLVVRKKPKKKEIGFDVVFRNGQFMVELLLTEKIERGENDKIFNELEIFAKKDLSEFNEKRNDRNGVMICGFDESLSDADIAEEIVLLTMQI